jgi:hypothetical protein
MMPIEYSRIVLKGKPFDEFRAYLESTLRKFGAELDPTLKEEDLLSKVLWYLSERLTGTDEREFVENMQIYLFNLMPVTSIFYDGRISKKDEKAISREVIEYIDKRMLPIVQKHPELVNKLVLFDSLDVLSQALSTCTS